MIGHAVFKDCWYFAWHLVVCIILLFCVNKVPPYCMWMETGLSYFALNKGLFFFFLSQNVFVFSHSRITPSGFFQTIASYLTMGNASGVINYESTNYITSVRRADQWQLMTRSPPPYHTAVIPKMTSCSLPYEDFPSAPRLRCSSSQM